MTPTWGEFMTKLRALYKEYPTASKQYESDYDALAARLAEVTDILANGTGVSPDTHANRMHAALVVLNGTADSATVCLRCHGTGAIDAATSADDPSCPNCDGEGVTK